MITLDSGDGKDIIFGFDDIDLLQITGDWRATYYKSSGKVAFNVGSTYSAITLQNFSTETFNVKGDSYAIKNNKFAKQQKLCPTSAGKIYSGGEVLI